MTITKRQFADEERRMRAYRKQGKSEQWLRGWLRKWRETGERIAQQRGHQK